MRHADRRRSPGRRLPYPGGAPGGAARPLVPGRGVVRFNSAMTSAVPIVPFVLRPADVSTREAEALLDSAVVVRSDDLVAEVVGPGAVACMQGLLTNDLEGPGEDAFIYGAVLT